MIIVMVVAIVGIFGFIGYKGFELIQSNIAINEANIAQPMIADDVPAVADVKVDTVSDLDEANVVLSEINLDDDADTVLLESEMAAF